VLLSLKTETDLASKMECIFWKLGDGQGQKKKIMSVNFNYALFSLLSTHYNLTTQTLVWLHMVQLRAIRFDAVQFSASHVNLRPPHIYKQQI